MSILSNNNGNKTYSLNVEVLNPEMDFSEFKNVFTYYYSSDKNKDYLKSKGFSSPEEIDFVLYTDNEDGSSLVYKSELEPYGETIVTVKDNRKKNKGKDSSFSINISFSLKKEDKSWMKDYLSVFNSYYIKTFDIEKEKKASKVLSSIK